MIFVTRQPPKDVKPCHFPLRFGAKGESAEGEALVKRNSKSGSSAETTAASEEKKVQPGGFAAWLCVGPLDVLGETDELNAFTC